VTANDGLRLADVRGFMFDVDGTLLHRGSDGRGHPQPGAVDVLERIRATGRKLAVFTGDEEMITPVDSATTYLRRRHPGVPVLAFASEPVQRHMSDHGVPMAEGENAGVVFVAHLDELNMADLDRAARAVTAGAPLFTGSYVRGYAGANGMIFSHGAMITAAIAKVTGARPRILGKPSRAAVQAVSTRLDLPTSEIAVVGDDLGMDIALGRMGGSRTVLVRSGISGDIDLNRVPAKRRPDAVVDGVADLLDRL
jgi:NagD protein